MLHFPVTPSLWRGIWDFVKVGKHMKGPLRRACDWKNVARSETSFESPTCVDCAIYRQHLFRLGKLKF